VDPPDQTNAAPPVYAGKFCTLVPLDIHHAPLYEQWLASEQFQAYHPLLMRACPTQQAIKLHILQILSAPAKIREVVVWHRSLGVPVGLISLSAIDEMNHKAELSVGMVQYSGSRCVWEAIHASIALSFEHLQLYKLVFHVNPANTSLCELLLRGGFTQEGLLRQEIEIAPGKRMDLARFALFHDSYRDIPLFKTLQQIVPISP
jgi:RimJ/RimL family protein N-acetyltransferase